MDIFTHLYQTYLPDGRQWSMEHSERFALLGLLNQLKPTYCIEIGSENGGSTIVLSQYAQTVYALDIDPQVGERVKDYPKIEFIEGDSKQTLPPLLNKLADKPLGLIFIDGDHSSDGVYQDAQNILAYQPTTPLYLIFHDSFNPAVRQGLRNVEWSKSPYVHAVDLDFIAGGYSKYPTIKWQMWGGLALAILLPHPRSGPLEVQETSAALYKTTVRHSVHYRALGGYPKLMAIGRKIWQKMGLPS